MFYKIYPISIFPKASPLTTSEVYLSEVGPEKELLLGKLFILAEIESREPRDRKLIDFLVNEINFNYYRNEAYFPMESPGAMKTESLLETTLTQVNLKLQKNSKELGMAISDNSLNLTVGVIHKHDVFFSSSGKNKAYALTASKQEDSDDYKIFDILKQLDEGPAQAGADENIFSSIISGALPKNGYLVFSNEALSEYLSSKQLINIVTKLPPQSAAEQIKNELSHINSYISFLAVIVKSTLLSEAPRAIPLVEKQKSFSSITNLNNTEKLTEKLLTPSGMVSLTRLGALIGKFFPQRSAKMPSGKNKLIFTGEKIIFKRAKGLAANFFATSLVLAKGLPKMFYRFSRRLSNPENLKLNFSGQRLKLKSITRKLWHWLKNLKLVHKLALAVIIASIAVFSWNIATKNTTNKTAETENIYQETLALLEQKKNTIDSNFLYNKDNQELKGLLDEFKLLIDQLPQDEPEYRQSYTEYLSAYEERMAKIRNVVEIEASSELADLSGIDQTAGPGWIFYLDNEMLIVDRNAGKIFRYIPGDNLLTMIYSGGAEGVIDAGIDGNRILLVRSNSITGVDAKNGSAETIDSQLDQAIAGSLPLDTYNNRLYALNRSSSQIQRFNKSGSTYSAPQNWLKENIDLQNAVDISIDGKIFLAFSDGQVLRLLSGRKENFSLDEIDPELASLKSIYASRENDRLYVLDPENRRIAVFDKNGDFIRQYHSDNLDDLKDMAIDEKGQTIYLLNGSRLLKFQISG